MNFNQLEDYQEEEIMIKRRDYSKLSQENCKIIGSKGSDPCQFKYPYGICIDKQNEDLYISEHGNQRIQV